jgi:uncharacterized protein YdeI (YjbR/CyaY-like superfamily)/uncharacterized protein YdhG (YjbR/CyaY superfamily)
VDYIEATAEPARSRLRALRAVIRDEAPDAVERMAYGLATWHQRENVIHLGAWTHHIGVYPGAAATVAFADELRAFKTSKGAIRIPHDVPLPLELVRRIARWRVEQIARAPATRAAEYPRVAIASRGEWRTWLEAEHLRAHGAWVVSWKKHVGAAHVDVAAISEEALCFGWVDSLPRAFDADRSMLLVTPRKAKSAWSAVNKERVARLTAAGLMAERGLAVVAAAQASGTWHALDAVETLTVPDDLAARFRDAAPEAQTHWDAFPRSVKRGILEWIQLAKRPETRAKRIEETVAQAAMNVRANQWKR